MDLPTGLPRNKKRKHKYTIEENTKGVYSQISWKLEDFLKNPSFDTTLVKLKNG